MLNQLFSGVFIQTHLDNQPLDDDKTDGGDLDDLLSGKSYLVLPLTFAHIWHSSERSGHYSEAGPKVHNGLVSSAACESGRRYDAANYSYAFDISTILCG